MKNKIGGRFYLSTNDYIFDLYCFIFRQINLNIFDLDLSFNNGNLINLKLNSNGTLIFPILKKFYFIE